MKIAMTGTSGNMGREALKQTLELENVEWVRILLSYKKQNDKLEKKLKKQYGSRIQVVRGSVGSESACKELVQNTDYVIHMAAVIPPASDKSFKRSEECNYLGAVNMVNAVKALEKQPKYIHVSTVALYGNRDEKHPWGRVGDPLLVSPFDAYAMHKLKGELYCLEAGLECWAVLRQTAMLYPEMMAANIKDGLMFHTAINAPLEWSTSRDSGRLVKHIFERDSKGEVDGFWKKIYNIGAGYKGRETGYDTFNDGFKMIGGSSEKFFKPNWMAKRNFHGVWFADGDELEQLFHYQQDGVKEYWAEIADHHKIYKLGKCVPKGLIYAFLFRKLLHHENSPYAWVLKGDAARVQAYFGGQAEYDKIPTDWKDVKIMAKGDFGNYDDLRDLDYAKEHGFLLSHGYDESKGQENWSDEEMQSAATYRGGECLTPYTGDAYAPLKWKCCEGHEFEMNPYTVLRGGHWCPKCMPMPWKFDLLAKKMPFYSQVWYDSHSKDENYVYSMSDDNEADMEFVE